VSDDPTQSTPVEPVTWSTPVQPAPAVLPPTQPANPSQPPLEPVRPIISAPRRSSSGRWLNLLLGVAAAVAIGGIAFAVGRSTAPVATGGFGRGLGNGGVFAGGSFDPNASFAPGRGGFGAGGFGAGGLTVSGTVASVTGDTLTITTDNGRTVEVSLGADTQYHQQAAGTASDVTTGSKVSVQLDLAGRGQANGGTGGNGGGTGGTGGNGTATGPTGTASDVTVIP
jgi:hypothetical protein